MSLTIPQIQRSFAAGELAPGVAARADLPLYQTALRTCRNVIVQRFGGATNRPGSKFVAEVKTSANNTWLKKFIHNLNTAYVIEVGAGYFRFYKNGARVNVAGVAAWSNAVTYVAGDLVVEGGVHYYCILAHINQVPPNATYWYPLTGTIYEIPTPYLTALEQLRATPPHRGVVTFTHKDYPTTELRVGATDTAFVLTTVSTAPAIAAPANLTGSAGVVGTLNPSYVVTAAAAETYEESLASSLKLIAASDAPADTAPNALSWDEVPGAVEYYVYKDPDGNGTFGFIGTATGQLTFKDTGYVPDFSRTPRLARALFASVNNYPGTAAYYQQRRVLANSHAAVETTWASRTGFHHNFGISSPLQADDAVTFAISGALGIQHLVALKRLLLLTDVGVWIVLGEEDGVLTPSGMHPEQEGYQGAAAAPVPIVIGNRVIYVQALARIVRDLRLNENHTGFESGDLTVLASHLFKNTIVRIDYAELPHSVVWCCRDDGVLLGLTYLPEFDVHGWHRHDTGGSDAFEDVCVVPEGTESAVYVVVRRTVNGSAKRYVERFASRQITTYNTDAFFVDCGITYNGAAATVIAGLSHLVGASVMALADGVVVGPFTVSAGGEITLTTAASVVHVGLGITAELETLDLDVAAAPIRDAAKRVLALGLLLADSARGFALGPDADHLFEHTARPWDAAGLVSGLVEENLQSGFSDTGRVLIRHTDPTPLTVLGIIPHVDIGG